MFKSPYEEFIYKRTYARWLPQYGRREDWGETIGRYVEFFMPRIQSAGLSQMLKEAADSIEKLEIVPSMRALWTAGKALELENAAGYNCTAVAITHPRIFAEILYLLMNGCGVGFSVERQFVSQLPPVPERLVSGGDTVVVGDSKRGWAEALNTIIMSLYGGVRLSWDVSAVRPKGAPLLTFGGRASGPEPLESLFEFVIRTFESAKGRRLSSVECHDIACKTAEIVVVGGVRRSACISLSNRSDDRMAHAKDGVFWDTNPQRMMANNSIAYTEKPSSPEFMEDWLTIIRSGSGERGIFNRESAQFFTRISGRRRWDVDFLTNPCGEVLLRPTGGMCNLSETIVRPGDDLDELARKVRLTTFLGCIQATLTKFNFIGRQWKRNAEEERLLGVSLTGLRDHEVLGSVSTAAKTYLRTLKQVAQDTAREVSSALGVSMPVAITCNKPSGTTSELAGCSSGLHPRFSSAYVRRVRVSATDPVARFLVEAGVPHKPEVKQDPANPSTWVFEFPRQAPETATVRDDTTALEQLNYYLMLKKNWCEMNPSITIHVKDHEWFEAGAWVFKNWDYVGGITVMPHDGGVYELPPYTEITSTEYQRLIDQFPQLDFSKLVAYEQGVDATIGAREIACSGNSCEVT